MSQAGPARYPPSPIVNGPTSNQNPSVYKPTEYKRSGGTLKCILIIVITLLIAAAGVLVPLYLTGVLKFGKSDPPTIRRATYDPFYYGNIHPYLYPGERSGLGIVTDYDVIVVGAGIAGLATANALMQGGRTVLVIEARDQVGGRILSAPFGRGSVEVGAQWLVGSETNPLSEYATLYKSPRATFTTSAGQGLGDGAVTASMEIAATTLSTAFWQRMKQMQNASAEELTNTSVADIYKSVLSTHGIEEVNNQELAMALAQSLTSPLAHQSTAGAPLNSLAAAFYVENTTLIGSPALSLGSLDSVPKGLASELLTSGQSNVLLSARVSSISFGALNATVQLNNGTAYRSQYVVCTLPLGVLREGSVGYVPALPSVTLEAMARLGVGTVNPVHLLFDTPFWDPRTEVLSLSTSPVGGWTDFVSLFTFTGEPILVALPGVDASAAMEGQTDAEVVDAVIAALIKKYGDSVPSNPVSYLVTRWGLNPYARGTHSYYAVGSSPADRATLAEPVGGTLMFAGEATSTKYPSTLHGAFFSGVAQASRILAATKLPDEGDLEICSAECYGGSNLPR